MNDCITITQIGCGYWGPNLLRNFSALPNCRVKYVVDASPARRAFVHNYPQSAARESVEEVLRDLKSAWWWPHPQARTSVWPGVSARRQAHFRETSRHQVAGGRVGRLCRETRFGRDGGTPSLQPRRPLCEKLIDAVIWARSAIYSQRLNLGRIRSDIDALWNFAPDISIIQYCWATHPVSRQG